LFARGSSNYGGGGWGDNGFRGALPNMALVGTLLKGRFGESGRTPQGKGGGGPPIHGGKTNLIWCRGEPQTRFCSTNGGAEKTRGTKGRRDDFYKMSGRIYQRDRERKENRNFSELIAKGGRECWDVPKLCRWRFWGPLGISGPVIGGGGPAPFWGLAFWAGRKFSSEKPGQTTPQFFSTGFDFRGLGPKGGGGAGAFPSPRFFGGPGGDFESFRGNKGANPQFNRPRASGPIARGGSSSLAPAFMSGAAGGPFPQNSPFSQGPWGCGEEG